MAESPKAFVIYIRATMLATAIPLLETHFIFFPHLGVGDEGPHIVTLHGRKLQSVHFHFGSKTAQDYLQLAFPTLLLALLVLLVAESIK